MLLQAQSYKISISPAIPTLPAMLMDIIMLKEAGELLTKFKILSHHLEKDNIDWIHLEM